MDGNQEPLLVGTTRTNHRNFSLFGSQRSCFQEEGPQGVSFTVFTFQKEGSMTAIRSCIARVTPREWVTSSTKKSSDSLLEGFPGFAVHDFRLRKEAAGGGEQTAHLQRGMGTNFEVGIDAGSPIS